MAKNKGIDKGDERLEVVEEALSKTEQFIESNQKPLIIVVSVIVLIVLGYFGLNKYYFQPREREADTQMFMAEKYFESDSLNKALYGDGNNPGFFDIIDDFGSTKAGNLACYYAGVSLLKQGEFEESIKYLNKFSSDDYMVGAMGLGAIGDAYLELNQTDKAADQYLKAAKHRENELTTPMFLFKAGQTYELLGNYKKAVEVYENIKTDYPSSNEGRNIEKYITRANDLVQ